ncbi:MAG: biopolymer transport protein TolR [Rhodobacteraceae bacterium]|nr:MAG: biopolymer transport protein TolR [Paracoccaceae bacterium]
MGMGVSGSAGGGGRRRRGRRSASMHEINITPMVDVMLVLLIIFMVAAPMLTVGVPVKLPETAAAALPTEKEEPLTVTITADGRLSIQTTEVSGSELIQKLTAIAAERTSKKIFLRADGAVAYERVAQVMGALNAGGFNEIAFVTDAAAPSLGADGASNSGNGGG